MGKKISFIGNPGTGKTTFLVSSIHKLNELGWTKFDLTKLPPDYGLWIDQMISGGTLPPTVKDYSYPLTFEKKITFKGSTVKVGLLGSITIEIKDLRGEDYRRTTQAFKDAVQNSSAVIICLDPSDATDLWMSLSGEIQPLIDGIRHMIVSLGKKLQYIGFIITKRSRHNHTISEIREFLKSAIGPVLRYIEKKNIYFNILEVDSRGARNRLEPWGLEFVYYDLLSHLCKVEGRVLDVTKDPEYLWIDTGINVPLVEDTQPSTLTPTPDLAPFQLPMTPNPSPVVQSQLAMVLVICPNCGYKSPQGLSKCKNCGAKL